MEKGDFVCLELALKDRFKCYKLCFIYQEKPRKKALLRCTIKILTRVKMLAQQQPSPRLDDQSLKIFWCALDPVSWAFSETNKISCAPNIA